MNPDPSVTPGVKPSTLTMIEAALKGFSPSEEQWRAISHPLEPAYLIAGAGSGKTAVMAARIVWTISEMGYLPAQVLGLTFTNKAAEELQERVRIALGAGAEHRPEDITVQTYHAFAAGIVREHGLLVEVEPEAGLLSEAQQWQLILSCLDDLPPFDAIELRSPGGIVRATLALASSLADHIVTTAAVIAADEHIGSARDVSDDVRDTLLKRRELCSAVDAYTAAKQRAGRIDFGDQVLRAVDVLESFPHIQEAYSQRYPVVLLDEYQDTNVAQRRLMQALVRGTGAVTAVGDARQAIYAFRGATMYNLIGFPRHFPRGTEAYEPISLSENFRSGARILEVANSVVGGIDPERRPGLPLRAHPSNGEGEVSLGLFGDELAEARFIAEQCEALHGTTTAEGRPPVAWRDLAILVRRKATMDAVLRALEEKDIPVEVVGLGGLLKTPEVIEIVAWLRSLETKPAANRWLARILLGPRWRIHYRDLALCARWAAGQNSDLRLRLAGGDADRARDLAPGDIGFSLAEALGHTTEIEGLGSDAQTRLRAFADRLSVLRRRSGAPLLELVQDVIRQSGVGDALESSGSRWARAARQNVANFLDHVASFAPVEGEATLRTFLAYLDAAEAAEETLESTQPAEQDSVKLMTVHSAKGLEFECVFVPSVAASKNAKGEHVYSVFPDTRASNPLRSYRELPYSVREDSTHLPRWTGKSRDFEKAVKERSLEDERRLFYVALTRAKQRLFVSAAWWYGRRDRPSGPSLFWDELHARADGRLITVVEEAEQPEVNPVLEELEARRGWPPVARTGIDDPLWPQGWGVIADELLAGSVSDDALLHALSSEDVIAARSRIQDHRRELDLIKAAAAPPEAPEPALPDIMSATSLVAIESGRLDPWDVIRPLPDRPTNARRVGTEVHRLIEERSRGLAPFPDEEELDAPGRVEPSGAVASSLDAWRASGFAEREPALLPSGDPMVELPFALRIDGRIVRGRIDAVYPTEDGGLEVVDFKTGGRFEPPERDQLLLYARALRANGLLPEGRSIRLTYLFLDGGSPHTRVVDSSAL